VQEGFQLVAKTARDVGDDVRATSASLVGTAAAALLGGLVSLRAVAATATIFHHFF